MSNQKSVSARLVRFNAPVPSSKNGEYTNEWRSSAVDNLVVFPDTGDARCTLRGSERPLVAKYHYYEPISLEEQLEYEGESEFKCDVCGQTFENSQGLGKHRVTKHPEVNGK